jgi:hypothetical protein
MIFSENRFPLFRIMLWYGHLQASIQGLFAVGLTPDQIYYLADAILLPGKGPTLPSLSVPGQSAGGGASGFGSQLNRSTQHLR